MHDIHGHMPPVDDGGMVVRPTAGQSTPMGRGPGTAADAGHGVREGAMLGAGPRRDCSARWMLAPRLAGEMGAVAACFLSSRAATCGDGFLDIKSAAITPASTIAVLRPTQIVFTVVLEALRGDGRMTQLEKGGAVASYLRSCLVAIAETRGKDDALGIGYLAGLVQRANVANYEVQQRPWVRMGLSMHTVPSCSCAVAIVLTVIVGVFDVVCMSSTAARWRGAMALTWGRATWRGVGRPTAFAPRSE